jgi:hypothetical protein
MMYNYIPRGVKSHPTTEQQSHLFDSDKSSNFSTIPETLITSTKGPDFLPNPDYKCSCRRGYSLSSDPFNIWKGQAEPANYSRTDIKRAYRLGEWY